MLKDEKYYQEKIKNSVRKFIPFRQLINRGIYQAFDDFEENGIFDIIGHKIDFSSDNELTDESAFQIFETLQIYRDKEFETSRYLFVDENGIIKEQITATSTFPNKSVYVPRNTKKEEFLEDIKNYCDIKNYRVLFCHNHPSGNTKPSPADIGIDLYLQKVFSEKYLGHVILNHDTFNVSLKNQENEFEWKKLKTSKEGEVILDPLLNKENIDLFVSKNGSSISLSDFKSYDDYIEIGNEIARKINEKEKWNEKDWITIIYTGNNLNIKFVQSVNVEDFLRKDIKENKKDILVFAINYKCLYALAFYFNYDNRKEIEEINRENIKDKFEKLTKEKFFLDSFVNRARARLMPPKDTATIYIGEKNYESFSTFKLDKYKDQIIQQFPEKPICENRTDEKNKDIKKKNFGE